MKSDNTVISKSWRKMILPSTLLSGLVAFFYFDLGSIVNWANLADHYQEIKLSTQTNIYLAQLAFCGLYFIAVAFSLPVVFILTLIGGAIFGWIAILLILPAATIGCFVVFSAARGFLSGFFTKLANPYLSNISRNFHDSPFSWLLSLRLIPVLPIWLGNIIPGLLGMNTKSFLLATLIGIMPGTLIYISFGRGLDKILTNREIPNYSIIDNLEIFLPLLVLFLVAFLMLAAKFNNSRRK